MFRGAMWSGRMFVGQMWTPAEDSTDGTVTTPSGIWSRVPRDSQAWTEL
jgi:hypothetical protein